MILNEIKAKYVDGLIGKAEYIREMHKRHACLFEYSEFIKDTDISKIEITDDSVVMTSRAKNIKLICDKKDERIIPIEILNLGSYEENILAMVIKLIDDNHTVLDIGANIGWYTINISKSIRNVNIFSFEPIPKTFKYLQKNLEINDISHVKAFNFGFSSEEEDLIFYYYEECSGNASLANLSQTNNVEKIVCRVRKMDNFVNEYHLKVDFIKCDVEGAELFVFQGGIETIKKHKPIIFSEMLRKWTAKFNYNPNAIIRLLSEIGYRCFVATGESLKEFVAMDEQTVETNFFFLHTEKHEVKINSLMT
jgi:FkbM family methyltransferase